MDITISIDQEEVTIGNSLSSVAFENVKSGRISCRYEVEEWGLE